MTFTIAEPDEFTSTHLLNDSRKQYYFDTSMENPATIIMRSMLYSEHVAETYTISVTISENNTKLNSSGI